MAEVVFEDVVKHYGPFTALHSLSLSVEDGTFLTLLGPSGCGKTTTLRMVAGFVEPSNGRILIGGRDVTLLRPQDRQIGMVFQDYALFPHMTVADNIGFGLTERRSRKKDVASRVEELLHAIRLPDIGSRYPAQISGGQQQRVAVARAIANPPLVLLMDEPLGALDLKLREAMQSEIRSLQKEFGITTIYVTHDQAEAMSMSDQIAVMNKGRIEQIGTPEEIYRVPRTKFVAEFIGRINVAQGRVLSSAGSVCAIELSGTTVRCAVQQAPDPAATVNVAVRPEDIAIRPASGSHSDGNEVAAIVIGRQYFGRFWAISARLPTGEIWEAETRDSTNLQTGTPIRLSWDAERTILVSL